MCAMMQKLRMIDCGVEPGCGADEAGAGTKAVLAAEGN
jgi:hypothetical protein